MSNEFDAFVAADLTEDDNNVIINLSDYDQELVSVIREHIRNNLINILKNRKGCFARNNIIKYSLNTNCIVLPEFVEKYGTGINSLLDAAVPVLIEEFINKSSKNYTCFVNMGEYNNIYIYDIFLISK